MKSSPFIACSQLYPKHYVSLTVYPIASDIKPSHRILSLTHRKCRGKPNIRILSRLLQKNKYGRSQLHRDHILSVTIYLYNRKFDWCLIVHPIWLVWHTYISHWSTDPPAHNIPDAATKMYFFLQKNNSKNCFDFIYWKVLIFISIYFLWVDTGNQQLKAIHNTTKYAPYLRWSHGRKSNCPVEMNVSAFRMIIATWSSRFYFHVIYQTRETVFYRDIQTPRRSYTS